MSRSLLIVRFDLKVWYNDLLVQFGVWIEKWASPLVTVVMETD